MLLHSLPLDRASQDTQHATPVFPELDPAPRVPWLMVTRLLSVFDAACLVVLMGWVHVHATCLPFGGAWLGGAAWLAGAGALWAWAAIRTGLYTRTPILRRRSVVGLALASCVPPYGVLLLASVAWSIATGAACGTAVLCIVGAALCVAASRVAWRIGLDTLLARGFCIERVAVIGESAAAARIAGAALDRRSAGMLRTVGSLTMPDHEPAAFVSWVADMVRLRAVDQFIIAEADEPSPVARSTVWQMVRAGADVTTIPRLGNPRRISPFASRGPDITALHETAPPLDALQITVKRGADLVAASVFLLLSSPVFLVAALAIKLDSRGPIFFRQDRRGRDGQIFRIWKFRTMFVDARDDRGTLQTCRNDARVTRIGRFLRKTSLDELPQLFNVLRGEMSIVGPRPHAVGMTVAGCAPDALQADYAFRHSVRPGITGWAQVNGCRGAMDTARSLRRRCALDRQYIENWSLRLDVWIVLRTVALPFVDRHAC